MLTKTEYFSFYNNYLILRTADDIQVTIISTGSETSLACDISHKLATERIYSKVISMPCQELFDQQSEVGGNAYFGVMINNACNTA